MEFPPEFKQLMSASNVRAAFVSEVTSPNPSACPNCGGAGTLYIYVATVGPLNACPDKSRLISHWSDGKWWLGKGFEFACPACSGKAAKYVSQPNLPMQPSPVRDAMEELEEKLSHTDI